MSSDIGLQFQYGAYLHDKGDVYPRSIEIKPLYTEDGIRWAEDVRMSVSGHFSNIPELTEAEVNTRMGTMATAYDDDYKDAKFLLSDGSDSNHILLTNDANNLSGNRVLHRSWDNATPTELANTRSFSITIGARYLRTGSDILYFKETTRRTGNGGPKWELHNRWNAPPERETIFNQSKVYHVTTGRIVALTDHAIPPAPYWPEEEKGWLQSVQYTTPRFHGDPTFQKGTHYVTDYAYYFERVGAAPMPSLNFYVPG